MIIRYKFDMSGIMVYDDAVPNITNHVFRKCGPEWRIWESQINGYELTYVIKGKARYTVNGTEHELEVGDLLYLTDGDIIEAHTYPQDLMRCFTVNFTTRPLAKRTGIAGGDGGELFAMVSHIGVRQDVITMFRELTLSWNERSQGYVMKTRGLLMLILCRLSEIIHDAESACTDFRINRVTRYIAAHYAEKLTVKSLAQQINLDRVYFGHLFKTETGLTVHQYMTKVRVEKAEALMQGGRHKIHEVAELCGFSDIFHFYKAFKSLRGFAPSRCLARR